MGRQEIYRELKHLKELIALEHDEEFKQYVSALQNHSIKEQRNLGICWYPVRVMRSGYDAGERLLVRVARMPEHQQGHAFQSGKLVRLFSNTDNKGGETEFVTAIVNNVAEHEMLLTINAEELPEWLDGNYLGVQLLFDENVFREMNVALDYLLSTKEENINRLLHVLLGDAEARFAELPLVSVPRLNTSQNQALNNVLGALDLAIIHGPPGTGKTTTLVESVIETLKTERQTMVTASSNAAVDLLVEKFFLRGINVVRLGHPARVNEEVLQCTLDFLYTRHETYKDLKAVRKQAEEYQQMASKYKRNFGEEEREQRRLLYAEARKLRQEARQLSYFITADILAKAQVIACTLHGASHQELKGFRFQTVFIDEASQALEPASWIPLIKAGRVIFAGDHQQLPPTIKSFKAAQDGLQTTLFEKAIKRNSADVMLKEQYRMNEKIMQFSSQIFYHNQLVANEKVAKHVLYQGDEPFEFIDTAGTGFFEASDPDSKSIYNKDEAYLVLQHFLQYIERLEENSALRELQNLGIISPYKAQAEFLKSLFLKSEHIPHYLKSAISVNTVDSFQGQERDVVYISFTRSNEKNEIGFLSDIRRMNVAMTRARKKLVLVGDSATLAKHSFYAELLDYMQSKALYRSAFEFMKF